MKICMEKKEFATQISELYWRQHDNVEHPKLSVDATVGFIFDAQPYCDSSIARKNNFSQIYVKSRQ